MKIPDEIKNEIPFKFFIFITLIVFGLVIARLSIVYLGNDNIVEQQVEKIIKKETGVEIDFSPPELKN